MFHVVSQERGTPIAGLQWKLPSLISGNPRIDHVPRPQLPGLQRMLNDVPNVASRD